MIIDPYHATIPCLIYLNQQLMVVMMNNEISLKNHMIVWNDHDVRLTKQGGPDAFWHTHPSSAGCAYVDVKQGDLAHRIKHLKIICKELRRAGIHPDIIIQRLEPLEEYSAC